MDFTCFLGESSSWDPNLHRSQCIARETHLHTIVVDEDFLAWVELIHQKHLDIQRSIGVTDARYRYIIPILAIDGTSHQPIIFQLNQIYFIPRTNIDFTYVKCCIGFSALPEIQPSIMFN